MKINEVIDHTHPEYMTLFHGTNKKNVDSIKKNGLVVHKGREQENDGRGGIFLSPRPDVAFGYAVMGGEHDYLTKGKPKDLPDNERAMFVFHIPKDWYNKYVHRVQSSSAAPEVSFNVSIPPEFIADVVVGNRQQVYSYLRDTNEN